MRISYISACFDASGYAEAARNHIAALHSVGVTVDVKPVSFEGFKSDLGRLGAVVANWVNQTARNDIQILHLTPENYVRHVSMGKYNIGYCAWETSKLPAKWVPLINQLNEVWVPCEHNKTVFEQSGVIRPVYVMPHPLNSEYAESADTSSTIVANKHENDFVFYSIFQWTERKNPLGLLKAYLTEFSHDEHVCLLLKTYLSNPSVSVEIEKIKQLIKDVKARLYLKQYPRILLVSSLLSRAQIQAIHKQGDCFISLHRAEGFGLPIAEAMLAGNPVITTAYGGPADFVNNDVGCAVKHTLTPCYGMPWDTYTGHMLWAEPDIMDARTHMRSLFNNRELAKQKGERAKQHIKEHYSWEQIGNQMKARLEEIKI
jgi:glycosyltransferase involved in cell wall biosynthesis